MALPRRAAWPKSGSFCAGPRRLNAGSDPAVYPVVVVADDPAGVVATPCGDRVDAAIAAITEDLDAGE